jgi:hypothetical protein
LETRVTRLGEISLFGRFFMAKFFLEKIAQWSEFFLHVSKIFKKLYLLFYVRKTIKECPVPLNISIKSNRNTIKQFYIANLTKTWLGNFLGDLFTKTSGHPACHKMKMKEKQ